MDNNWYNIFFSSFYLPYFSSKKENRIATQQEVNFISGILNNLPKEAKILDLACGTGRHLIELAKLGFNMTGFDFNEAALKSVRRRADGEKLVVRLIRGDMRLLPFNSEFDAVICMYTSFGYFMKESDNIKTLEAISKSLKRDGFLLLDLPNKAWITNKAPRKTWQKTRNQYVLEERSFNKSKNIFQNEIIILSSAEKEKRVTTFLRLYDSPEIREMLHKANLELIRSFGDYNTTVQFDPNKSPRMILLARKKYNK